MTSFRRELRGQKKLDNASTLEILRYLYKRHETEVLYSALSLTYTLVFLHVIGVV